VTFGRRATLHGSQPHGSRRQALRDRHVQPDRPVRV